MKIVFENARIRIGFMKDKFAEWFTLQTAGTSPNGLYTPWWYVLHPNKCYEMRFQTQAQADAYAVDGDLK